MTTGFPLPGIIIDPGSSPGSASITTPAGGTVSVFSDRYGVSPVTLPAVISKPTTYYVAGEGPWLVNGQVVEVLEGRQVANVGPPVPSSTQQPVMVVQGAAGNGTTDDTAKMQATITAAGVLGAVLGTQVRVTGVPGAVYFCTFGSSWPGNNFYALNLPSNVVLDGLSLKFPDYTGGAAYQIGIYGSAITNSDIRNCTITGAATLGESEVAHMAILLNYSGSTACSNITVDNNFITGWRSNGVLTLGDNASVFPTNIQVSGNTFTLVSHLVNFGNGATGCSIVNNYGNTCIQPDTGSEAFLAQAQAITNTYTDILVQGNIVINWSFGVDFIHVGSNVIIDSNLFDFSANSAIQTVGINCANSTNGLKITNNVLIPGSDIAGPAGSQIWVGHGTTVSMPAPKDLLISGNTVTSLGPSSAAIAVDTGSSGLQYANVKITDNTCYVDTSSAVQLKNCTNINIRGNFFTSQHASPANLMTFPTATNVGLLIEHNQFVNGFIQSGMPAGTAVTGNIFTVTSAATSACVIVGNSNCVIANNVFTALAGTYAIQEQAGVVGGQYANNILLPTKGITLATSSTSRVSGNTGFNPLGHAMTQPAMPASGVALTNTFGVDATVYLATGAGVTVSVIAIGGTATGVIMAASTQAGGFRVPAGQTITPTYAGGTPTWQWFGD